VGVGVGRRVVVVEGAETLEEAGSAADDDVSKHQFMMDHIITSISQQHRFNSAHVHACSLACAGVLFS